MSSLGRKAVSGVLWNTGLNVFRDVLQFGVMLFLVRLLAPAAYGQFGLVTSVMGFLSVFSFRFFLEHTLQIRPGGEVDYQIHFTAGAVIQLALFLATNVAAEVLRWFPTYAPVASLVHVMSILCLIDLTNEFRARMLERDMDWKRLRILQAIGVVVNAVVSVIMAAAGFGAYALLVPGLLMGLPTTIDLFFVQRWRPTWKWDMAAFGPAWRYGLTRMMSGIFIFGRPLVESALLVKLAGFTLYGIYGRALGLAAICCLKVPSLLMQSVFPVLTKLEPGSSSSSKASTLVLCSVTWTTFPLAAAVSVLTPSMVHILYGNRWTGAIPFLPWAMAAGLATAVAQTGSVLLVSSLQQKKCLYIDTITTAGTILGLLFLAPHSLQWYLMGTAVMQAAAFGLTLMWLYRLRTIDFPGIANSLLLPAANVGISFLALEFVRPYLDTSTLAGTLCYGTLFAIIYLVLLRLTSRRQCREVVRFLPGHSYLERWLALET
jgi:O-antigen/teichoic acid export membrane protein